MSPFMPFLQNCGTMYRMHHTSPKFIKLNNLICVESRKHSSDDTLKSKQHRFEFLFPKIRVNIMHTVFHPHVIHAFMHWNGYLKLSRDSCQKTSFMKKSVLSLVYRNSLPCAVFHVCSVKLAGRR